MTHRDLEVYKLSMTLVKDIYALCEKFPKSEIFALTSQMHRAAISIPSNISEGAARNSTKEYIYFLSVSIGSASELETQLGIAELLGYCPDNLVINELTAKIDRVRYMLIKMQHSLEGKTK